MAITYGTPRTEYLVVSGSRIYNLICIPISSNQYAGEPTFVAGLRVTGTWNIYLNGSSIGIGSRGFFGDSRIISKPDCWIGIELNSIANTSIWEPGDTLRVTYTAGSSNRFYAQWADSSQREFLPDFDLTVPNPALASGGPSGIICQFIASRRFFGSGVTTSVSFSYSSPSDIEHGSVSFADPDGTYRFLRRFDVSAAGVSLYINNSAFSFRSRPDFDDYSFYFVVGADVFELPFSSVDGWSNTTATWTDLAGSSLPSWFQALGGTTTEFGVVIADSGQSAAVQKYVANDLQPVTQSLFFGSTLVDKLYFGSDEVSKLYYGDTLVYES